MHFLPYNVFDIIMYSTFFLHITCNNNVTFLFLCFWMDIYHVMVMPFCSSL
jgi:hypothetical protein